MNNPKGCWVCGKPVERALKERLTNTNIFKEEYVNYETSSLARHFCRECYEKHTEKYAKMASEYGVLKKQLMLERALKTLEDQNCNLYEYKDIIDQMQDFVKESPEKFDSSEEMIAAIILVGNGIKTKIHYKIDRYIVDFLIPKLKVVLEVDGHLHKHKMLYDSNRDFEIREKLGRDWEVVRIPTKYINENANQIIPAILSIKAEKQKIRKQNYGIVPEWYSKRDAVGLENI